MSIEKSTRIGKVVSDVNDKTIVVAVERIVKHQKYGKYVKRTTKMHAHDPENTAKKGDTVLIKPSRPFSKKKTWILVDVLNPNKAAS